MKNKQKKVLSLSIAAMLITGTVFTNSFFVKKDDPERFLSSISSEKETNEVIPKTIDFVQPTVNNDEIINFEDSSVSLNVSTNDQLVNALNNCNDQDVIYITNDITLTSTLVLDGRKSVTLESADNNNFVIKREQSLLGDMFQVKSGSSLILNSVTFDGGANWKDNDFNAIDVGEHLTNGNGTNTTDYIREQNDGGIIAEGRVISVDGGELTLLNNATIQNNYRTAYQDQTDDKTNSYGGGIAVNDGSIIVDGGKIENNFQGRGIINTGGGGLYLSNASLHLISGSISSNSVQAHDIYFSNVARYGGNICSVKNSSIIIDGGKVTNGLSSAGGGIYSSGTYIQNGGEVSYNCSSGWIGGIYFGSANVKMTNGEINNNVSCGCCDIIGEGVGALALRQSTMEMTGGSIHDNRSDSNGRTVMVDQGSISLSGNASITNNISKPKQNESNSSVYGGGIGAYDSSVVNITENAEISNNVISIDINNRSGFGAGLYIGNNSTLNLSGNPTINNNKITQNEGVDAGGFGAGIYAGGTSKVNLDGGKINSNQGIHNGGVMIAETCQESTLGGNTEIKGNIATDEAAHNNSMDGVYLRKNNLTITSDTTNIDDYIFLYPNAYLKLGVNIVNSYFNLSTAGADSLDGRIVVKPDGTNLTDVTSSEENFYHVSKKVVGSDNDLILNGDIDDFSIIDDFRENDGILVTYRTGETDEVAESYISSDNKYPYTYKLKIEFNGIQLDDNQLNDVKWTIDTDGQFDSRLAPYCGELQDGTNVFVAKKSGILKLTAHYKGNISSIYMVIPGDVTRDGILNYLDVNEIKSYVIGESNIVDDRFTQFLLDMDGDGSIRYLDSSIVQFMSRGLISPSN